MSRVGLFIAVLGLLGALPAHAEGALSSRDLEAVPLHVVPTEAVERARAALPQQDRFGPVRLAIPTAVSLGLQDGKWTEAGDVSVWRMRVQSAGATLLTAAFDRFWLPEGAELRFSDGASTVIQGPYTSREEMVEGWFWTAMVPGDQAVIEIRVPTADRDAVDVHLANLGHGIYPVRAEGVQAKSGGCNVDAICESDPGWRAQERAVVLLQIGGTGCSGVLVNTSAQDGRPYILTANHCGVTTTNAAGIIAYFNYQTSTCGGTPNGSLSQNIRGAQRLFAHSASDHTLIQLTSAIPANFAIYFAGFDASSSAIPQSGRGIHHPNGDEKRISTYTTATSKQQITLKGGSSIEAFQVTWSAGVTEPGSSGSGLWNENRRLVGVLSGGDSTCGSAPTSSNPAGIPFSNGPDYYGRLHVAWSAGLRSWLDPNTIGSTSIAGRDAPSGSAPPVTGGGTESRGDDGGGGGGSFGWLPTLLMLIAAGARRVTSRRASRAAGSA